MWAGREDGMTKLALTTAIFGWTCTGNVEGERNRPPPRRPSTFREPSLRGLVVDVEGGVDVVVADAAEVGDAGGGGAGTGAGSAASP